MKNKRIWIIVSGCLLQLSLAYAQSFTYKDLAKVPMDPIYRDFRFDSSKLLQTTSVALASANILGNKFRNGEDSLNSHLPSNGFFLYKLNQPKLGLPSVGDDKFNTYSNNTIYGHLFQQLVKHIFIDLAGGYDPNEFLDSGLSLASKNKFDANIYSKNWFASASALFTHTWKEFAFNADLGLTHAEGDSDFNNFNLASNLGQSLTIATQNKISFLHENAELTYRANPWLQPFVGAGLMQVMTPAITQNQSISNLTLPNVFDFNEDRYAYKVWGGIII